MSYSLSRRVPILLFILISVHLPERIAAATLSGTFSPIAAGSNVNLTAAGKLDWVHWGLYTDTSVNRKTCVTHLIGDFKVVGDTNGFTTAYQFADNANGYSWFDGDPVLSVTNTTTGVWAYGFPALGSGFEIDIAADTTERTAEVFVGAFKGRGTLQATLSDGSAPQYTNSSLLNVSNGPGGVYALTYAAGSTGQVLHVKWTLTQFAPGNPSEANVTLQAVAVTSSNANNPPHVAFVTPADNATFAEPAAIMLNATAQDFDGTVTNVVFYAGTNEIGQSSMPPYAFEWTNVSRGHYVLTAFATDDGGVTSCSQPIGVFVYGTGGMQAGGVAPSPSTVDLTAEGTTDWTHWGLLSNTSFDHKNVPVRRISNFTVLGMNSPRRYSDNYTSFSWSDGTPTLATNTATGVFIYGVTNGFQLTAPADTLPRKLRVYVGGYGTEAQMQAYLSDLSAPPYTDESVSNIFGNSYVVYTIDYAAASAGQQLNVIYRSKNLFDLTYGNVTIQSATLEGGLPLLVSPTATLSSSGVGGGPFSPSSIIYTLTNVSGSTLEWTASNTQSWVSLSATGGSLAAGATTEETVSINTNANALAAGSYTDTVSFVNTTGGEVTAVRTVTLMVTGADQLTVTPAGGLSVSGTVGGPFSPPSITYTLTNSGGLALDWTASNVESWVSLSATGGSLAPGTATNVTVSINTNANGLPAGSYSDSVNFVNATSGNGNTSRSVNLTLNNIGQFTLYITNAARVGNDFVLSFNTQTGQDYTVEYADALPPPAWSNLITVPGTGGLVTVTNYNALGGQRYFRVRTP
jgi:hypothetical protein